MDSSSRRGSMDISRPNTSSSRRGSMDSSRPGGISSILLPLTDCVTLFLLSPFPPCCTPIPCIVYICHASHLFGLQEGGRAWEDMAGEQNEIMWENASEKNERNTGSNEGRRKVKMGEEKEVMEVMEEKEVMVIRSNGLTQTDRDYFNIVKTEDGMSNFFRVEPNRANDRSRKQPKSQKFLFHSVRREEGEKVAALYLPDVT